MSSFQPLQSFKTFKAENTVKIGAARTGLMIVMVVLALAIGIMAAIIGRKYGDENCNCIGVNDAGFRAFSIAMISVGVPLLVVFFIFFGCTTAAGVTPE